MKKIGILLIAAVISGCASSYELSSSAKQTLASLNTKTAEKNIETLSRRSKQAGGLCLAGSVHTGPNTVPVIDNGKLQFTASYEETTGYSTAYTGSGYAVTRHYTLRKGAFAIKLLELKSIRIISGNNIPACQYDGSGKIVVISDNAGMEGMINVTDANLDLLIASLHFLSPDANLKQGIGL